MPWFACFFFSFCWLPVVVLSTIIAKLMNPLSAVDSSNFLYGLKSTVLQKIHTRDDVRQYKAIAYLTLGLQILLLCWTIPTMNALDSMAWNYFLVEMKIPPYWALDWIPIGIVMLSLKGVLLCLMCLLYIGFDWSFHTLAHLDELTVQLALGQRNGDNLVLGQDNISEKKTVPS